MIPKKNLSLRKLKKNEQKKFIFFFSLYIKEITKVNYLSKGKLNYHLEKIKKNYGEIKFIIINNNIVGFIILYFNFKKLNCYISDFLVIKKLRNKNFGKKTLKKIIQICLKKKFNFIKIDIINTNKKIIGFWLKQKFKKKGKSYYFKTKK